MRSAVRGLVAGLVLGCPPLLHAQQRLPAERGVRPELRLDAIVARRPTVHAGVGLERAVGNYARIEGVLAAGSRFGAGGPSFSARGDALVRFVVDPFVRLARTPYVAGGVSLRRTGQESRADLVALLGVQLPARRGYLPALELGFGGGVRIGLVLRRGPGPQ